MVKSRLVRCAGHIAHMGEMRNIQYPKPGYFRRPDEDEEMALKRILKKQGVQMSTGSSGGLL